MAEEITNINRYREIADTHPVASVREEAERLVNRATPGQKYEEPSPGRHSPWKRDCPECIADKLISEGNIPGVDDSCVELIRHDESRTDEKLLQAIAAAEAEADARDEGDTRDEESLEDHNIQGLGAYRDVFDADGEQ